MRNQFALVGAALMVGGFAFAQKPQGTNKPAAKAAAAQDLTNLLDGRIKAEWQAIKAKDQKALGELLTEEHVAVEADAQGARYKWKTISELQQSSVADATPSFLNVTQPRPNAAVAPYK